MSRLLRRFAGGHGAVDQLVPHPVIPLLYRRVDGDRRSRASAVTSFGRAGKEALFPDEVILALELEHESRAYPILRASNHLLTDTVGGVDVIVTYCRRCRSAVAFERSIHGRTLDFQLYGAFEGSFAMQDAQTGTIWSQLTGEGLDGPLVGRRLRMLAAEVTTLARWTALHPSGLIADLGMSRGGDALPVVELPANWRSAFDQHDDRLEARQLVIGVEAGSEARAYAVDAERPGPRLFEDEIGGIPVALVALAGGWPLAYERRLGMRGLHLRWEDERLVDTDGRDLTRQVGGERGDATLRFLPSRVVEWYAWALHRPDTTVSDLRRSGSEHR